jgi:hypothetical protein
MTKKNDCPCLTCALDRTLAGCVLAGATEAEMRAALIDTARRQIGWAGNIQVDIIDTTGYPKRPAPVSQSEAQLRMEAIDTDVLALEALRSKIKRNVSALAADLEATSQSNPWLLWKIPAKGAANAAPVSKENGLDNPTQKS